MTAECPHCGAPAAGGKGSDDFCSGCHADQAARKSDGDWREVDFTTSISDTYPPELLEREQWMGRKGKLPFAPWANRDEPIECTNPDHDANTVDECDCDARWKWGYSGNYVDGQTVALAEDDPRLDGRVFLQREEDPYAFVDGDDVRDPVTGDVHPGFRRLLSRLGITYADVSTSGSGVHAYYRGDLPDAMGQTVFDLDSEPWGTNDDPPTVEIYANKHVNVATGEHISGTPVSVSEWDSDALNNLLAEHDALKDDSVTVDHDTDRDLSLDDHDPTATTHDEVTTDARDIAHAVDRLRPTDLPLATSPVGEDGTGWEKWDPSSYRTSSGNDSLHRPPEEPVFHDFKHGESFGVLSLFAAEQGIISKPWHRLAGDDWWEAVSAARDGGAPIPEYDGPQIGESEPTAVLPDSGNVAGAVGGWDWQHTANRGDDNLTIEDARERTRTAIARAYDRRENVLVEALPTMGKSYGSVAAAAETGLSVTILTGRGRKEQYDQLRDWCKEHELDYYTLPSFTHDCLTGNGEHGDDWRETVMDWYRRGATPQEIHKSAEYILDRPLPCQVHDGQRCPYASKWDFDPDEYDVLIGHYAHAYKPKVTTGRAVVFDEFPDAYETQLGPQLQGAVSHWLDQTDEVPFDEWTDLIERRDDDRLRAEALQWFAENDVDVDEGQVFEDPNAHASAPLAVFTLLTSHDLGNGFETADLDELGTGVYNRQNTSVSLLRPPALEYATSVVALDGTPTMEMWELSLGIHLNHRPILDDRERGTYIEEALNLNLVRTTEYVKPYNSSDHVNVDSDAALLEKIATEHGEQPSLITTSTAEKEYDVAGVLDLVDETKHYGNVLGSNEFAETRLGAVVGSNHYGDGFIKKWGAFAGERVERNDEKGDSLSYGQFGDKVLTHMREHETLQAAMRFGRDGNGAVVYVHTDSLPDWVRLAGEGRVIKTWSEGMRSVLTALEDLDMPTATEIADHPAVEITRRAVLNHLESLREREVLTREQDDRDGRRVVWHGGELHRVNEYGSVELDPVEIEALADEEVAEVSRSSIYTWSFRNTAHSSVETGNLRDRVNMGCSRSTTSDSFGLLDSS